MTETHKRKSHPAVSAIELADTGEWHLIVYISRRSLQAWLRPRANNTLPGVELFRTEWDDSDENPLREIENAVYDHPRILEDYSTDIIVETPRTLWIPRQTAQNTADAERIFTSVWPGTEEEMCMGETGDLVCMYYLAEGLQGFLRRTFPGTRTSCHQEYLVSQYMSMPGDEAKIFVDIRDDEADITAIQAHRLLTCTTQRWKEPTDITWHVFNILDLNLVDPSKVQITISGQHSIRQALSEEIRPYAGITLSHEPVAATTHLDMPMAAQFCYSRKSHSHK